LSARGTRAVKRALRRHRSLRVSLVFRAVDPAGNVIRFSRTVRVRG
jgi:hypothetical protein